MITLGLIGVGKWGQNYLKLEKELDVKILTAGRDEWQSLIKSKVCDGIIIATPPDSHIDIAIECLKHNIPIMIEKPLSLTLEESLKLKKYQNNTSILVNYIHLFAPAFQYMLNKINLNEIKSITSNGSNSGPYRNYSALLDYGPHDIAMSLFLTKQNPEIELTSSENNFIFNLKYKHFTHNICVGNRSKNKNRFFQVETIDNKFIYDDTSEHKLTCDGVPIFIENQNYLFNSINCFLRSINGKKDNRLGLDLSFKVMEILEKLINH